MTLEALTTGSSADAHAWLLHAREGAVGVPADFNWHGFAFAAAANARTDAQNNHVASAERWATVALSVYGALAEKSANAFSFVSSAMHLRVWFIRRFGAQTGHAIRDVCHLERWFDDGLGMSIEQATAAANELRAMPIEHWRDRIDLVRELRQIKNRLSAFCALEAHVVRPDIQRWLEIRDLLP